MSVSRVWGDLAPSLPASGAEASREQPFLTAEAAVMRPPQSAHALVGWYRVGSLWGSGELMDPQGGVGSLSSAWQQDPDLAGCTILLTGWQTDRFSQTRFPVTGLGPSCPTVPASASLEMNLLHHEE